MDNPASATTAPPDNPKASWPKTPDGTIDWEVVFESSESGLIPLVMQAQSIDGVKACTTLIIDQLFTRKNDEAHRAKLNQILTAVAGRAESAGNIDFARDGAIKILRSVKQERILKAAAYVAKKKREAEQGVSSRTERRGVAASIEVFSGRKKIIAVIVLLSIVAATLIGIATFMSGSPPGDETTKATEEKAATGKETVTDEVTPSTEKPSPVTREVGGSSKSPGDEAKPEYPKTVYFKPLYWVIKTKKGERSFTYYQPFAVVPDAKNFTLVCTKLPSIKDSYNLAVARIHPKTGIADAATLARAAERAKARINNKLGAGSILGAGYVVGGDKAFQPNAKPCH